MKKTFIIIIIIVLVIVGGLLAIPVFFKQNLLDATRNTLSKELNADVEFEDLSLSLFRNFPKATLKIENVAIKGRGAFNGDTIMAIGSLHATTDLSSLFKKSGISIEELILRKPLLQLKVNETGISNWEELAKNNESVSEPSTSTKESNSEESDFELLLDKIEIHDARFIYEDKPALAMIDLSSIDLDISGKMYGSSAKLKTTGKIDNVLVQYNQVNYLSNVALELETDLDVDYEKMDIRIGENEFLINLLPMELNGLISMPSDSMFFELELNTKQSDFENFLALVPPAYEEYLKDIQTSGTAGISGTINGYYYEENYPAFSIRADVEKGNLKYADLPEQIKNINADIELKKPQGELDLTEVAVKKVHAEIKNNPVDLTLKINHLFSDPFFDGAFVGKVNLDHLKEAIPIDSVNISGEIDANLFVNGNYSAIEEEAYDNLHSDGIILLNNIVYDARELTQKVFIPKGQLDFSPQNIRLQEFKMKVGQSDFSLVGKVSNYLNYFLNNGVLTGDLRLKSEYVNLNELLRLQVQNEPETNEDMSVNDKTGKNDAVQENENLTINIPENLDITFQSNIKNAMFDRLPISDINGLITAKGGKLMLNQLKMQTLEGEMVITGSYQNTVKNRPLVDFGLDITEFDIPLAYSSLTGLQRLIPVAGQSQGKFNSSIKIEGQLSENNKFIPSTVDGKGLFSTRDLKIVDSPVFNQLKGILKSEKLKNVDIDDFSANFTVEKGNIDLKPFTTKIAGQETRIEGSINAENLINMRLDFNVQREAFGPDIQNILSIIPGNKNIKTVPAGVIIKGPVGEPEVKMDLSETRKAISDATKDDLQKSLDKLGKGLKKLFEK